jgi:hypothetical protein
VTISQLYGLYRAGYDEARAFAGPCVGDGAVEVRAQGLAALERVILELAVHDVTNGTPMRTWESFRRAVRAGADLLASLGLDPGSVGAEGPARSRAA